MTEERGASVPTAGEACKHLWLPVIDDASENLHMLTVLSTLGPHRLDAGRYIVTSRCRSFDRGYVVGALSTGRHLPAVAPRYSSWEMRSGQDLFRRTVTSTAFQVTAPRITQKSYRLPVSNRTMVGRFLNPPHLLA